MEVDLYNMGRKYERAVASIKQLDIPQRNKELILEFAESCLVGWEGEKLSLCRVVKYLSHLKHIALLFREKCGDKEFDYITRGDVKKILVAIDRDPRKGEYAQYDYRVALRKFITWLRKEHGYPEGYPEREQHLQALNLVRLGVATHVMEVQPAKPKRVEKLRETDTIPRPEYLRYMHSAVLNPRDRAFLAIMEELGPRIGGIGTRRLKHVEFDELGARIQMHDKTMRGETVRLTWSTSYLREWIEVHPFKNDPESPLWVKLNKTKPEPLEYDDFRAIVRRAIRRHNRLADARGLPKIPRNYDLYAFRYFAQIRDELKGVPRRVQEMQRGWVPGSKQPSRYARLAARDVDEYFRERFGLVEDKRNGDPQPCPRCRELNPHDAMFCRRCTFPLNDEAAKHREAIVRIALKIIADPEMSDVVRQVLSREVHFSGALGKEAKRGGE